MDPFVILMDVLFLFMAFLVASWTSRLIPPDMPNLSFRPAPNAFGNCANTVVPIWPSICCPFLAN